MKKEKILDLDKERKKSRSNSGKIAFIGVATVFQISRIHKNVTLKKDFSYLKKW